VSASSMISGTALSLVYSPEGLSDGLSGEPIYAQHSIKIDITPRSTVNSPPSSACVLRLAAITSESPLEAVYPMHQQQNIRKDFFEHEEFAVLRATIPLEL